MLNPQLNRHGELKHLLTLDGLSAQVLTHILDTARLLVVEDLYIDSTE